MSSARSYHTRRGAAEEAMSALATSSVARIAHGKLAVLHVAKAADVSVKVTAGRENVSFVARPTR